MDIVPRLLSIVGKLVKGTNEVQENLLQYLCKRFTDFNELFWKKAEDLVVNFVTKSIEIFIPKYAPFGNIYHFTATESIYKTQVETKLLKYSNIDVDERRKFFKSFLNEIKPDLVQIQQHSIENYLREIQLRIGLIMDNEEMKDHLQKSFKYQPSKDSIFPFQSFQFLNDPTADYHFVCNHIQCISTYKVSLRLNGIGMSYILKLHVKNAFKEVISEKEGISNEKAASFTFDMLKYEKIEISVVSIFGESPLAINYKDVVKLDKLTGKELKIATMPLEDLSNKVFYLLYGKKLKSLKTKISLPAWSEENNH
jgi:hypothetical protein